MPTQNFGDGWAANTAFGGISCLSTTSCVTAGYRGGGTDPTVELVHRLRGATWTRDTTPGHGPLAALACNAPNTCTAVGQSSNGILVERSP